jgi:hypothetical protein
MECRFLQSGNLVLQHFIGKVSASFVTSNRKPLFSAAIPFEPRHPGLEIEQLYEYNLMKKLEFANDDKTDVNKLIIKYSNKMQYLL